MAYLEYVLASPKMPQAVLAIAICLILYTIRQMLVARRFMVRMQKAGFAMPEFSLLSGHLLLLKKFVEQSPPDSTINTPLLKIAQSFPNDGVFYFDLWPFTKPLMIVTSPSGGLQLQQHFLDKPAELFGAFQKLCGGPNMFTMPEQEWKRWRGIFNPAFSSSYMLELVPAIARETLVFCEMLRDQAKAQDMFQLENLTLRLTVDVIGAVTLDTRLHYQKGDHPLASALRTLIEWTAFGSELNPFKRYNVLRPIMQWSSGRKMDKFIHEEIDKRFDEIQARKRVDDSYHSKSIISLVLEEYLAIKQRESPEKTKFTVDKEFYDMARSQIRLFLFAGHDTTSSTLIYCYYMLSTHPDAMNRVRQEHEEVFGDASQVYQSIVEDASRLNRLPYTNAVIKEVMRLFPAASASRSGRAGVNVVDNSGRAYPTEGCFVWVLHLALHRNEKYWKDAHSFIPERWLVGPEDPLHPMKGASRPFEFGPRSCIGQTLATMELRVVLAMTIREFDIGPAYDEWDEVHKLSHVRTAFGNRAYQVEGGGGGAHPAERYPCRISLLS